MNEICASCRKVQQDWKGVLFWVYWYSEVVFLPRHVGHCCATAFSNNDVGQIVDAQGCPGMMAKRKRGGLRGKGPGATWLGATLPRRKHFGEVKPQGLNKRPGLDLAWGTLHGVVSRGCSSRKRHHSVGGEASQRQFWFSGGLDNLTWDDRSKKVSNPPKTRPRNNKNRRNMNNSDSRNYGSSRLPLLRNNDCGRAGCLPPQGKCDGQRGRARKVSYADAVAWRTPALWCAVILVLSDDSFVIICFI
jgi:hypothetical protein